MEPAPVGPPPPHLQLLETAWPIEAAAYALHPPPLALLPRGDGAPVLVLPGFTADDRATSLIRRVLRHHGFWVSAWELGHNLGPTRVTVEGMRRRLTQLKAARSRRVALVGSSLAGVYARALARELPQHVSQVITLASPCRRLPGDRSSVQAIWNRLKPYHDGDMSLFDVAEEARQPLKVPATSIYTRTDGVVPWELCVDTTDEGAANPRAANIEVYGTHTGMSVNSSVLYAVVDRLVRLRFGWRRFTPPPLLRGWYPTPAVGPPSRARAE